MHSTLPDLWDLAQGAWEDCSGTSRFVEEGAQQDLIQGIKSLTNKPVVGVGRFTSPDLMVKQIKSGNLDFIGAARPSIADPFLPNKIRDGKIDEIRECIGCNICVTGDMTMSISRCTQNPSFMEEWRKGWHPENFQIKGESKSILVIGSGPAGLEATRCLSKRGYNVTLAEKNLEIVGLIHLMNEKAENLSTGQKKLLELGRTMMVDAKIVLLDEVGAGVNRTLLKDIGSAILRLNKEKGYTFCMIEHDMEFISRLCNPVIVMAEGSVLFEGTSDEVKKNERVIESYLGRGSKSKGEN